MTTDLLAEANRGPHDGAPGIAAAVAASAVVVEPTGVPR